MITNALLVRYATGFVWVEDAGSIAANGRREDFLSAGSVSAAGEATRVGQALLAERSASQLAYGASMDMLGVGDVPYVDFAVGDYVTAPDPAGAGTSVRVMALTVAEDEDGATVVTPELNTLHQVWEQRLAAWLQRMANGTLDGTVQSATPLPPPVPLAPLARTRMMPPWTTVGTPDTSVSKPYRPPDIERVVAFKVEAYGNTANTTVVLLLNGASTGVSVTVPSGGGSVAVACSVMVNGPAGDYVQVQTTAVGGATSITATALLG